MTAPDPSVPADVAPLPQNKEGFAEVADAEIKTLQGVVAKVQPSVKPGAKTTEFVVTFIAVVGSLLGTLFHKQFDLPAYTTLALDVVSGALTVAYVVARTALKYGVFKHAAQKVLSVESDLSK